VRERKTASARLSTVDASSVLYPEFKCRAWANWNGTGVVAIRASGNVSSITDNGTGDFTANFTTEMPDANYSVSAISGQTGGSSTANCCINVYTTVTGATNPAASYTNSSIRLTNSSSGGTLVDPDAVSLAIFR
jgi:hypothetical protein